MKKLLILVPCISFGGLENVAIKTAEILKNKFDVHLLFFYKSDREQKLPSDIKIKCINTPYGKSVIDQASTFTKRHFIIKKYKRDNNFDYCLSVGKTASYTNLLTKKREKCITSIHGYSDIPTNRIVKLLDKYLFNKSDEIICVCKALKNEFYRATGVINSKLKVVYNPFNTSDINKKCVHDIEPMLGAPIIIMYGRIVASKNYELGILALKELLKEEPDAVLNIVGDGEHKTNLLDMVHRLKVEKNVNFINGTDNPYKYVSKADIYISASFNEGFSYTIVEAMTCKTPIIATDCKTGFRESLAPESDIEKVSNNIELGRYGVLIPPCFVDDTHDEQKKKAQLLASAIKMLYNDKELMQEYRQRGFLRAREYDVNIYKDNLINLLES